MKNKLSILTLILTLSFSLCFGMKPDKNYAYTPKGYGFTFKEMKVKTTDNFTINMWHIMPKLKEKKNITVVLCSGDSGNMSYLLSQALNLDNKG